MTSHRLTVRGAGMLLAAGVLALAGCSSADESTVATSELDTQVTPVAQELSTELLLAADEMPDWNAAGVWEPVEDAESTEAYVLRACPLATPESLGATDSVSVVFEYVIDVDDADSEDPDYPPLLGVNTVAQFPDATTAEGAVATWEESLEACSAYQNGQFDGGSSWTVAAIDPEGQNEAWFDFTAIGSDGARTTLVGFSVYGQDANYDGDPFQATLPASLDRLNP